MPQPKKRGRPRRSPMGRQVKREFSVSPEHAAWLDALPNRSAWLSEQIDRVRSSVRSDPLGDVSNSQQRSEPDTFSGV